MFFEITATDTASIIDYGKNLVADFMPILVIVVGIFIAVYIIRAILRVI